METNEMIRDYNLLIEHIKQSQIIAARFAQYLGFVETPAPTRGSSKKRHELTPEKRATLISKRMKVAFRNTKPAI